MQPEALSAFCAHAQEVFPSECCGVLILVKGRERYVPCRNTHPDGGDYFEMHPEDFAAAEDLGDILGICHSHSNFSAEPTESDRVMLELDTVPWYTLGWPSGKLIRTEPTGWKAPLIGRTFFHGVLDCYALCRDYYSETHNIQLPDYPRKDEWWLHRENLYLDNFKEAGFHTISEAELKPGDAILMQIFSPVPNHAAIYLGDNVILQHLQGRLSGREIYGGFYRKATTHFLRHRSLC